MNNYPLLNLFWTMLEFFLWILWFFLLFKVLTDLFRDHSLSGWAKAGWIVLVILLPLLGVLLYVIFRGKSMAERDQEQVKQADAAMKQYIRESAGTTEGGGGQAEELKKLSELKASGALTEEEFQRAKTKLLA
ncbi:SHOCT domain-containing protein [Kitasatospora azatica]|uniref:SHOCT domain-containing protein n=1 Tax=Kitasatospora azatica TaxID=58347 RepID=UPI000565F6C9|nr:SHOCT domain-containing protein [Kitasatospora azatica]